MSDEMLVRHCSPTLAGLKTGNIFSCSFDSIEELRQNICVFNRRLSHKGLCILPLRIGEKTALIYVYRPKKLERDLLHTKAEHILRKHGYTLERPARCIRRLMCRLNETGEFPHEIGLFLGYPPEDVSGFIKNSRVGCKLVGVWKVYGDEEKAKIIFERYKKCTDLYIKQYSKGYSIERLTVAV